MKHHRLVITVPPRWTNTDKSLCREYHRKLPLTCMDAFDMQEIVHLALAKRAGARVRFHHSRASPSLIDDSSYWRAQEIDNLSTLADWRNGLRGGDWQPLSGLIHSSPPGASGELLLPQYPHQLNLESTSGGQATTSSPIRYPKLLVCLTEARLCIID